MSKTIENYWYSEINSKNCENGILKRIANLYSKNYGTWLGGRRVSLSLKMFRELHCHGDWKIYFASDSRGDIVGFISLQKRKYVVLITSECVEKSHRQKGIFKNLLQYMLDNLLEVPEYMIGVCTPNPVVLWTIETNPNLEYIDLGDEIKDNTSFGINISILFDEFRRKSYNALKIPYKRQSEINNKKLETGFTIEIPKSELKVGCSDLIDFYSNLMGTLGEGEEWILFTRYGTGLDNKVR